MYFYSQGSQGLSGLKLGDSSSDLSRTLMENYGSRGLNLGDSSSDLSRTLKENYWSQGVPKGPQIGPMGFP